MSGTAHRSAMRLGCAAFALLSAAVTTNLMLLQPPNARSREKGGGEAVAEQRPIVVTPPDGRAKAASDRKTAAAASPPAPAVEPAGNETPETIKLVQRELQARGYDAGAPDGIPSLVTRAAIMAWEHDHGLPLSGIASEGLAKSILAGKSANTPRAARAGEKASPYAEQVIRTVQQSLANLGYAPGAVNGRMTAETARAVREFELDQGLAESGRIGGPLVARLGRLAGQGRLPASGRVAGR